jgi:RimJ/RimL family protein N-acetyltransferase
VKFRILQLLPSQWQSMSEDAHLSLFGEKRPSDMDRVDYVLLGVDDETNTPLAYITVRELDKESVYWQFGGTLPPTRQTVHSFRHYQEAVRWTLDRYQRITTLIENDNAVYLKMAAKVGFKIIGVRTFKGKVLLEHLLEKES